MHVLVPCIAASISLKASRTKSRGVLLGLQRKLPCFCFEFVQSEWHGHYHSFPRGGSGASIPVHTTALTQTSFSYSANGNAKCPCKNPMGS